MQLKREEQDEGEWNLPDDADMEDEESEEEDWEDL